MASTIRSAARPAPPSGVMVSLTGSRSGDNRQVPRRGTCKGVRAGSGAWATLWDGRGAGGGRRQSGLGDGHRWRPRPLTGGGAVVLEVVEAGRYASDVERPVGVHGAVALGDGERSR
jgi:hypothetical protein